MNTHSDLVLSDEVLDALYDLREAQDAVRYLIVKTVGIHGLISPQRLGGLLYLAEREFLNRYNYPLTGDIFSKNAQSFVLQKTHQWLTDSEAFAEMGKDVVLIQPDGTLQAVFPHENIQEFFSRETHLSDADIEVLDFILLNFIHLDAPEIADYIYHTYSESNTFSSEDGSITHLSLFQALRYEPYQIHAIMDHLEEVASLNLTFTQFRSK
jgi:hypothetical protein